MTRVERRVFLAGTLGLLAAPLAVEAQAGKVYRIGYLLEAGGSLRDPYLGAFLGGMRRLGYTEGENLVIELRSAHGSPGALPDLATGLARLNVDVILTAGDRAIRAAQEATKTIPIVMAAGPDLSRPGLSRAWHAPGGILRG